MQLWPSAAQHYRMAGSEQEPEDALADRCLVWSLWDLRPAEPCQIGQVWGLAAARLVIA